MKNNKWIISFLILLVSSIYASEPPPLLSTTAQEGFFEAIKQHCGKAYSGKVVVDNQPSDAFANKDLIMHVRSCSDSQLHIPFHVGDDRSRTWIITKTGSGLSLKHDHRHKDGTSDELTMYGGHTQEAGFPQVQSFPADAPTIEMFVSLGIPQSNTNIWQMYIYPDKFTYRLIREGREFKVDFNLNTEIKTPPPPWGHE